VVVARRAIVNVRFRWRYAILFHSLCRISAATLIVDAQGGSTPE
jgi:hypothetical protein